MDMSNEKPKSAKLIFYKNMVFVHQVYYVAEGNKSNQNKNNISSLFIELYKARLFSFQAQKMSRIIFSIIFLLQGICHPEQLGVKNMTNI